MKRQLLKLALVPIISCLWMCPSPKALAEEPAAAHYAEYYNPETGFRPAQRDFTKIFLQLAGSLEHHGSPEPYFRHIISENGRIAEKCRTTTGKDVNALPEFMTDSYVERLLANWSQLSLNLKLESFSRQAGRNMRWAIMGSWNMPITEVLSLEANLGPAQKRAFADLLGKQYFKKADFEDLDRFYADPGGYDRLSEIGRAQLSRRVALGTIAPDKRASVLQANTGGTMVVRLLNDHQERLANYLSGSGQPVSGDDLISSLITGLRLEESDIALDGLSESEGDALRYSHKIRADLMKRLAFVDQNAPTPDDAQKAKLSVISTIECLAVLANVEFHAALLELGTIK